MPKPSRSPFYFYADEYRRYQQRVNGRKMNINEAITACYDDWKVLSDDEKQRYKTLYEEWRVQYRANPQPTNISNQCQKAKKESSNDKILRDRDIPCEELKTHYDRFSLERDFLTHEYLPLDITELLSMPIYLINFQIFCKVDEEDGGQFIPAEMCILRYTLAEGVTVYRQKFIKPEKIPSGYMSSCLEHLKETHEIPINYFSEATDNYKMIYQELKSFLLSTIINKTNHSSNDDDRSRRRYLRLIQPCVFFPALEYEQTSKLLDWLQEKAEGNKPTKDTRLVNLASVESLIMVLAQLKKHRVSRDDIHKTFENAAYSFMIEQRCPFHFELGISHCSVARCHASAKLITAYLNQLYVPERPPSSIMSEKRSQYSVNKSSIDSMNNTSNRIQQSSVAGPTMSSQKFISRQNSSTDANDSIASSYYPSEQRKQFDPYQSNEQITKLQQQNFHRLLSNADYGAPSSNNNHLSEYAVEDNDQITTHPNMQRIVLNQRKQILLQALQTINNQMEELDMQ